MNKKSAIKEMFWGNRGTHEQTPLSEDFYKAEKKAFEGLEAFLEKLNKEEKELFDTAFQQLMTESAEYAADHFVEGFKFGLSVGLEVAEGGEE